MGKEWDQKAQWWALVEEEQTNIYSLAFWLTREREAALRLAKDAVTFSYHSDQGVSKVAFLEMVVSSMCQLFLEDTENRDLVGTKYGGMELELVLRTLLRQEGSTRMLVLFHCLLKFDRDALAEKLGWSLEKLNYQLNKALGELQSSFLSRGIIAPS